MKAAQQKRMQIIKAEAKKTFGDDYSRKWLKSPSRYFRGKTPIACTVRPEEADKVLEHIRCFGSTNIY